MNQIGSAIVAMSGGVDSAVAAALLKQQGYRVLGATLRLFGCDAARRDGARTCCSREDIMDAIRVAQALEIQHVVLDFQEQFRQHVMAPFVRSYAAGQTPNPCTLCNQRIKFEALMDYASQHGFHCVATGHHAIIDQADNRFRLRRGRDRHKDQSYFLFPLNQEKLSRTLFPVGRHTKAEVRRLARDFGLPVADKRESQEICFVVGDSYVEFLQQEGVPDAPGDIVDTEGNLLGRHQGLHRYTIGQRKGIRVAAGRPLYVMDKDVQTHRLIVSDREALLCSGLSAREAVYTCVPVQEGDEVMARIRYRTSEKKARITRVHQREFDLQFLEPVYAVAPGQAVVLYREEEVLGGAWIQTTTRP